MQPQSVRHNILPRCVPSTTLKDPGWNIHVLDGDVEAAVHELNLRIYPVVVADGRRLFPERGQTHDLTLVESKSTPSGVTLQTYRPAGRATFRNAGE